MKKFMIVTGASVAILYSMLRATETGIGIYIRIKTRPQENQTEV